MQKNRGNTLLVLLAFYSAAAFVLLPFISISNSQEEGDELPEVDITRIADYDISVQLNPADHTLTGKQTVSWVNPGEQATDELYFHLYMNAFSSADTTFFEKRGGWSEDAAGSIDIESIRLADGQDLMPRTIINETVMHIRLPAEVAPRERISLSLDFTVQLPKIIARTGYSDNYHMVAQWYPKLGVYLDDEWQCRQFHSFSEFFGHYGMYRVEITVPKNYEVEATGIRQRANTQPDTKTLVYAANPVNDFAWAASPYFRKARRELTYTTSEGQQTLEVHLMLQRDRQHVVENYFNAIQRSLEYFSRMYGEYPYPVLKVIDPGPGRGMNSAAMEYPMLIVGGSTWIEESIWKGNNQLELVTAHEVAHQFFPIAVGSNEVMEPWLDEGLATYAEGKIGDTFGPLTGNKNFNAIVMKEWLTLDPFNIQPGQVFHSLASLLHLGNESESLAYERGGFLPAEEHTIVASPSYRHRSYSEYYSSANFKPSLAFRTLENMLGEQTFSTFLRSYYQEFKFRHPTGADFRRMLSSIAGEDLEWFFKQVIDESKVMDYRVATLDERSVVFENAGTLIAPQILRLNLNSGEQMTFNWHLAGDAPWMEDFRTYSGVSGVEYRLRTAPDKSWLTLELRGEKTISSAQIDPDYIYVIDSNLANNSRRRVADSTFADAATTKWIRLISRWLHGISVYN